jgi:hypothetical protein
MLSNDYEPPPRAARAAIPREGFWILSGSSASRSSKAEGCFSPAERDQLRSILRYWTNYINQNSADKIYDTRDLKRLGSDEKGSPLAVILV